MFKWSLLAIIVLAGISACAEMKSAGRSVGHTTRDVTRTIGHTTRDVTKTIGHETRDATKQIGHGTRDTVTSVKDGWEEAEEAERDESADFRWQQKLTIKKGRQMPPFLDSHVHRFPTFIVARQT